MQKSAVGRRHADKLVRVWSHDAKAFHVMIQIEVQSVRDPEFSQRLNLHREHSGPLMADLKSWLDRQIDENLVEPNSGLGKAII
jgi:hypothetical protein